MKATSVRRAFAIGLAGVLAVLLSIPASGTERNKQLKATKSGAHNSAGEDSRGLFQINTPPRKQKLRPGQTLEIRVSKPGMGKAAPKLKQP